MPNVEFNFEDNSIVVKQDLAGICREWLYEAAGELASQAKRNQTRVDSSATKNAWTYRVLSDKEAVVGNPLENAIWEEFGTGEYALKGGGSGYWIFVKGGSGGKKSGKRYTLEQAKRIVAMMRAKGIEAYYTKGKTPLRPLHKAYTAKKDKIQKALQSKLKGLG